VEYLASQEAVERFPQFSVADYERSIQWIDLEGDVFEGAEAVFRALACAPDNPWPLWIYRNVPGFAPVAEWGYRTVAKNRGVLGTISACLLGKEAEPSTCHLSRKIFLVLLGFIYLFAFGSLWLQLDGLIGSRGILPAAEFLDSFRQRVGEGVYLRTPTIFWLDAGTGSSVKYELRG
jgi:predicted DCC family thiol-disulfide oxidoreductase YuxK